MRELYFFNLPVTVLMKKNQNKITRAVLNTWSFPLQNNSPTFSSNTRFLQKKKTNCPSVPAGHCQIQSTSIGSNKFLSYLLTENKNLLFPRLQNKFGTAHKAIPTETREENFPFFNRSFDKKRLKMLFSWYYANRGEAATFSLVETLQKLGFTYAMKAGISLGVDDLKVPPTKGESLTEAVELLSNTKAAVNSGNVTALEEFQQFVDTWHRTSENLKTSVVQNFSRSSNFLKKSNLNTFSNKTLEKSEKIKVPLLDLRSNKNKEIKFSNLNQVHSSQNFFSTTQEKASLSAFLKNNSTFAPEEKELLIKENSKQSNFKEDSYKQKQKSLASYNTILNPVYMMAFSGARGNLSQVRQLVGMRGLMADPQGQLVEFPIQSNFREGLTVTEYMISCYGARKGLVDTALRTAAAGYLTRRLVDVSHHQIVRFVTCGTKNGILLANEHNKKEQNRDNLLPSAWKVPSYSRSLNKKIQTNRTMQNIKSLESVVPLSNNNLNQSTGNPDLLLQRSKQGKEKQAPLVFCVGRVLARDIPGTAFRNQEIDISLASSPLLQNLYNTSGIYIRSPLTCKAEMGICQLCYGWSVSANRLVGLGEAVGIIAAQSIGEPGTQLTMRTFHTGGVFSGDIMEECRAKHAGVVVFQNVHLGLLVRTAGGAIAFCLKTPAIFQIKGANEITTYTVSANTLLFVRQGEKVTIESLLAQIPNLPTVEESTGESFKTIVSDLSGEVRQKATVNPELASIRILAGQKCKQFYFFDILGVQNKQNKYSTTPMYLQKHLIPTNYLNNKVTIEKNNKDLVQHHQWKSLLQNKEHLISFENSKKSIKDLTKTKGLVNLIWGAHRLGNNKTFSININGSNSEVVFLNQRAMKVNTSLHQSSLYLRKDLNRGFSYSTSLVNPIDKITQILNTGNDWANKSNKNTLLLNLRVLIASKIHRNKFHTFSIKKNSGSDILCNDFLDLSKLKLDIPSKNIKTSKFSHGLLFFQSNNLKSQSQFINFKVCKLIVSKTNSLNAELLELKDFFIGSKTSKQILFKWPFLMKPFLTPQNPSIQVTQNTLKDFKNKTYHWFNENSSQKLVSNQILIDKNSSLTKQFYKNTIKRIEKKNINGPINKISTLTKWPELTPPKMSDYGYFFWKLEDLVFFRSNFTKKIHIFYNLRVSVNQHWWGNKTSDSLLCKKSIIKNNKKKHIELMSFLKASKKTAPIKDFTPLILKLFSRFNIRNSLNNFQSVDQKTQRLSDISDISLNGFNTKTLKPRLKFQESGEIFPLQGNTNLGEFRKKFRSLQIVTGINSGLLIHHNRISYKIPLCFASKSDLMFVDQINKQISIKEQLSFLRSMLAVYTKFCFIKPNNLSGSYQDLQNSQSKLNSTLFGSKILKKNTLIPQIGDFINTGDEITKQCASAYCGQVIEKSPVGLTLRLTQNILYSNLRNRPAKINKSVKNGHWVEKGAPLVTLPYISNVTGDIVAGIPKIEQLFEARGEALEEIVEKIWTSTKLSIVPRSKAVRECFKEIGLFVVAAIQKVYSSQGVHIADKHLEVIIRQMTRRALIVDPGDTEFLPEEFVELNTIECVNWATYGNNAIYRPRLIGITKASLTSNSFLSSASFQQTARVLERETVLEKTDRLLGLKERVMMGALINAGTGELKTSVKLSDRSLAKSLSDKLFQRLNFFSRRKIETNKNGN